jgi:hypothetical protein
MTTYPIASLQKLGLAGPGVGVTPVSGDLTLDIAENAFVSNDSCTGIVLRGRGRTVSGNHCCWQRPDLSG